MEADPPTAPDHMSTTPWVPNSPDATWFHSIEITLSTGSSTNQYHPGKQTNVLDADNTLQPATGGAAVSATPQLKPVW